MRKLAKNLASSIPTYVCTCRRYAQLRSCVQIIKSAKSYTYYYKILTKYYKKRCPGSNVSNIIIGGLQCPYPGHLFYSLKLYANPLIRKWAYSGTCPCNWLLMTHLNNSVVMYKFLKPYTHARFEPTFF
jgi:hypothetical protein